MAKTHWKKLTNPNYLGVYSLQDGADIVLTIKAVVDEVVVGMEGKKEECTVIYWQENAKPMIANKTNLKMIDKLLKTPYIEEWEGKKIQIGSEKVKAFGETMDALRVRNKLPVSEPAIECTVCHKNIAPSNGMTAKQVADYAMKNTGAVMCMNCMREYAANKKSEAEDATNS